MPPRNQQTDKPKTTLYHSELLKLGEVQVKVIDENKPSKFRGKPPYAVLRMDGVNRNYEFENESCEDFFKGQTGVTMVILAEGSREEATLTYIGEGAENDAAEEPPPARNQPPRGNQRASRPAGAPPARTAQPPARTNAAPPAPQSGAGRPQNPPSSTTTSAPAKRQEETPAQKVFRARVHAAKVANVWLIAFQAAVYARREAEEQLGQKVSDDQFRACVSTICVQLEKDGFHHLMPSTALELNKRQEPKKEAPPTTDPGTRSEPSDNDGANAGDGAGD